MGSEARAFVAGLARAGKMFKNIKIIIDVAYGVRALQQAQIYWIMKLLKDGKEVKNERGHEKKPRESEMLLSLPLSPPPWRKTGGLLCESQWCVK